MLVLSKQLTTPGSSPQLNGFEIAWAIRTRKCNQVLRLNFGKTIPFKRNVFTYTESKSPKRMKAVVKEKSGTLHAEKRNM